MRTIRLDRVDEGHVAEGVEFTDGRVVLKWLSGVQSVEFYDSIADLRSVREASGRSVVTVEEAAPADPEPADDFFQAEEVQG